MRYYRDMEVSSATSSSSLVKKPISKGSISHLHLETSKDDVNGYEYPVHGNPNPDMGVHRMTPETSGIGRSLYQRFSKTFSLRSRFGSSSSVNKVDTKKTKGPLGSSPDLLDGNG